MTTTNTTTTTLTLPTPLPNINNINNNKIKQKNREPQSFYEKLVNDGTLASYEENKYKTLHCFNQAIQHSPTIYLAYLKRGIEFFNLSLKNRAIEDFERSLRCIREHPLDQPFAGNSKDQQQLELILNGLIAEVNGDVQKSKTFYENACSLHVYKPETLRQISEACSGDAPSEGSDVSDENRNSVDEETKKKRSEAEIQAIDDWEDDLYTSYAFFSLGFVYCSMQDYSAAVTCYKKSIAFGPMHSTCIHYNNLGFCLECLDLKEEAYSKYYLSLQAYDRCLKSMFNIAKILNQVQQKYDEALQLLDKIYAFDPSQQDVWIEKGEIYLNQGKSKEAEECFEKAIRIDPSVSYAYVRLASAKLFQVMNEMQNEGSTDPDEMFESGAHMAQWKIISDTILRDGKNNMIDDQEVLKFHVFEKVISQSLEPERIQYDSDSENLDENAALKNLEQGNLKTFLSSRQKIFLPETRFNRCFKQALLCCTNITYYDNSEESTSVNSPILRSPLSANGGYEYYFEQFATVHDKFADCFIYFQD